MICYPGRDVREGDRRDRIAVALERLQGLATACIPDFDRLVVRRRHQPGRVVREGDRPDPITVALEHSSRT